MNRSSILMLLGAVSLGALAVFGARSVMERPAAAPATEVAGEIIVAARDIAYGDRIDTTALKTIPWPGSAPEHAFRRVADVVADGQPTALKSMRAGEPVLAMDISGKLGRLSTSSLLGAGMRAVTIAVDEVSGTGGFVAPGDRVDVLVTHKSEDGNATASIVSEGLRVLAAGQVQDLAAGEPKLVRSLTLEASPEEAQKLALARSIGTLDVALRGAGNEARAVLPKMDAASAFGIRLARQPSPELEMRPAVAPPPAARAARPVAGSGPEVSIVRGMEATSYRVAG